MIVAKNLPLFLISMKIVLKMTFLKCYFADIRRNKVKIGEHAIYQYWILNACETFALYYL